MLKQGSCPNCGGHDVVPDVPVIDRARTDDTAMPLEVRLYRRPDVWIDKGLFRTPLKAWICGACGYTELFAQEPRELLRIYREQRT
jgi:hypothetical protein